MTIVERLTREGIRRIGSPARGFRYRLPGGGRLSPEDRERILGLKIPPAWKEVAIHTSPKAAVQAVGMDRAGRWQYLYHEAQALRRERKKQERLVRFIGALPKMRRTVAKDLRLPGIPREKVLAGVLRILGTCFLRPGSEVYADENGSYGIATLRKQHVTVKGDTIRFDFKGKSGKRQVRELKDRKVGRLVRELLRHPGEVFKFRSPEGELTDVRSAHINAYIKAIMGDSFSAKDFRTWAGTLLCASALARRFATAERSKTAQKKTVREAIREVAEHLGNTPAVCRSSYVFPTVIRSYERGRVLSDYVERIEELTRDSARSVERSERALLELLR